MCEKTTFCVIAHLYSAEFGSSTPNPNTFTIVIGMLAARSIHTIFIGIDLTVSTQARRFQELFMRQFVQGMSILLAPRLSRS